MSDKWVPTHWKLLWLINWFLFNWKDCWASNETLWKKLWVSERTIRQAVSTLEKLKLISVRRTVNTRVICSYSEEIEKEEEAKREGGGKYDGRGGGSQLPPNSVNIIQESNSDIDTNVSIQASPVWTTEISTEVVEETYGNKDMNEFLSYIQKVVEEHWYLYRKGNQERNRAWNILKSKEVCAAAEKNGVSSAKFAIILLIYSFQSKIYAGKVTNAESLWYKWDKLYNEWSQIQHNSWIWQA